MTTHQVPTSTSRDQGVFTSGRQKQLRPRAGETPGVCGKGQQVSCEEEWQGTSSGSSKWLRTEPEPGPLWALATSRG